MLEDLVRVKGEGKIKELSILARIEIDHPVLVRKAVLDKLSRVVMRLPKGIYLQIDSGYRGRKAEESVWDYRLKQNKGDYRKTEKLVSNPNKRASSHASGGSVDISLVDKNGKEINLSEPFDKYYCEPQLMSKKISKKAQELRLLLNKFMFEQGFAPNKREYWHFTYGSESWAKFYKKKQLYKEIGFIPSRLLYPLWKRIAFRLIRRIWRLLRYIFRIKTSY